MKFCLFLFTFWIISFSGYSQPGCTDPRASNYNSFASSNDGSCSYPATSLALTSPTDLPATINETSALIYSAGGLWTLNDSGNGPSIFKINESDGSVIQTVTISNATNIDWEELTADATYFYIGDFGNNASGDRTDLKIYRVLKSDIGAGASVSVTADVINFSYPDQVISGPVAANTTKYDCEAFIIKSGVLHLFTKDWSAGHTQHYSVPSTPGTYTATMLDEYNVNGLITGATISATNEIMLIGYTTNLLDLFAWVLYDYSGSNFFSGNKRKLDLGHSIDFADRTNDKGQTEGITFTSNGMGYISSERINRTILGTTYTVPPRLYSFTIADLITLPVRLVSFSATYIKPDVRLEWQTSEELNNDYFSVQRSRDAVHYDEIGRQHSLQSTNALNKYFYIDKKAAAGVNYYRLKQVDADGRSTLYNAKAVRVPEDEGTLKAYLNGPGASELLIDAGKRLDHPLLYQLVNSSGVIVLKGNLASQKEIINISGLPKGGYFLRAEHATAAFIKY